MNLDADIRLARLRVEAVIKFAAATALRDHRKMVEHYRRSWGQRVRYMTERK